MKETKMTAVKKIEKVKSFDKRIELLTEMSDGMEPEAANACVALVAEKAKYGQHFAELVSAAGMLDFEDKEQKLLEFSLRANEHPTQAGTSAWVLSKLGLADAARQVMVSLFEATKSGHPNLYAQALSFGLLIPEMQEEVTSAIDAMKAEHPDMPETLFNKPDVARFTYLQKWIA